MGQKEKLIARLGSYARLHVRRDGEAFGISRVWAQQKRRNERLEGVIVLRSIWRARHA